MLRPGQLRPAHLYPLGLLQHGPYPAGEFVCRHAQAEATALLDDLADTGRGLVEACSLLADQLFHAFGIAEASPVTPRNPPHGLERRPAGSYHRLGGQERSPASQPVGLSPRVGDGYGSDRLSSGHGALSGREAVNPVSAVAVPVRSTGVRASFPARPVMAPGWPCTGCGAESSRPDRRQSGHPVRTGLVVAGQPDLLQEFFLLGVHDVAGLAQPGAVAKPVRARALRGGEPSRTKVTARRVQDTSHTPTLLQTQRQEHSHFSATPNTKPAPRIQQTAKPTRHPTTENQTPTITSRAGHDVAWGAAAGAGGACSLRRLRYPLDCAPSFGRGRAHASGVSRPGRWRSRRPWCRRGARSGAPPRQRGRCRRCACGCSGSLGRPPRCAAWRPRARWAWPR